MQLVSAREFRANQSKYFSLAETEPVYVQRRNARPIVISVAHEIDELTEGICQALREVKLIREGKLQGKSMEEFLNEL